MDIVKELKEIDRLDDRISKAYDRIREVKPAASDDPVAWEEYFRRNAYLERLMKESLKRLQAVSDALSVWRVDDFGYQYISEEEAEKAFFD